MDCDPGKIRNPDTGRCVSKTGAIGRRLMRTQAAAPVGTEKRCPPCTPEKICNPDTGRCVLKTGAIGRRLAGTRAVHPVALAPPEQKQPERIDRGNPRQNYRPHIGEFYDAMSRRKVDFDKLRQMLDTWPELANEPDDGDHFTPLERAAESGSFNVAKVLLEHGANPKIGIPLMHAISLANPLPMVKLLLAHGADPNQGDDYWGTPLVHAAYGGKRLELFKALLDAGADPNMVGPDGLTVYTAGHPLTPEVKQLLQGRR